MPFVFEFDEPHKILIVRLQGDIDDKGLCEAYFTVYDYVRQNDVRGAVLDTRGVSTFTVSADAIKRLAASTPLFPAATPRVIVAPDDYIYGMARMFQIIGGETRANLHVVRTVGEAEEILLGVRPGERN